MCLAFDCFGNRCRVSGPLDFEGYCKQHALVTLQCPGINPVTGVRCQLRRDLFYNGYCVHHRYQAPGGVRPIQGVCRAVSDRCLSCPHTKGIGVNGLCEMHDPDGVQCVAVAMSGDRCKCRRDINAQGLCNLDQAEMRG